MKKSPWKSTLDTNTKMKRVLYLGKPSRITTFLKKNGVEVTASESPISISKGEYDCIVSYGYRHKITRDMIDAVEGRAINLHISYLPWNRGANPNYWAWFDNTHKGVTIHYVDDGFDTGDIILQEHNYIERPNPTLETSYMGLSITIEYLFIFNWFQIFDLPRFPQSGPSTTHKKSDPMVAINDGYNTECSYIENYGKLSRTTAHCDIHIGE